MSESDDGEDYRKRAPGRPEDHPDWFISLSGGINSVAAALIAHDAIETDRAGGNFAKKPVAVYLDTKIGTVANRIYTEQFADWLGVQLWSMRTDESFLEWLRRDGAPGSQAHQYVRNELKMRQQSRLSSLSDKPFFVLGISAYESDARASFSKVREMKNHVEVFPVHRLSEKRQIEIILRSDCPINPLWLYPEAIKDCGCLANGDPSELKKTEELFPAYGQRMREYEEAIEFDGLKGTLGWNGLTAEEQRAKKQGQEQQSFPMCSDGCGRKRDPAVVRALRARAEGATIKESVSILYEGDPVHTETHSTTEVKLTEVFADVK